MSNPVPAKLAQAMRLHQAGQLTAAAGLYQEILALDGGQPEALHYLGLLRYQQGLAAEGAALMERALPRAGAAAGAIYVNLGNARRSAGDLDGAALAYRAAITRTPGIGEIHDYLGSLLLEQDRVTDAVPVLARAVELAPRHAAAWLNYAQALERQGNPNAAIAAWRRAMPLGNIPPLAHLQFARALAGQGLYDDAEASCRQAIALAPQLSAAQAQLGAILFASNRLPAAEAALRQALALEPGHHAARLNLAHTLYAAGQLAAAEQLYRAIDAEQPDQVAVLEGLGKCVMEQGRPADALAIFDRALALAPQSDALWRSRMVCLLYHDEPNPQRRRGEARRFAAAMTPVIAARPFGNDREPARRLKIGYLSTDFRVHSVGRVLLPLIEAHDREKVEIHLYADVPRPDAMTERFRGLAFAWHGIEALDDAAVADFIRADGIDILISCAGRFDRNRWLVPAHRAAPVQISLHDPATSGLDSMDYYLTDSLMTPARRVPQELFSERVLRLPGLFCHPPVAEAPDPGTLPMLRDNRVTFGSCNNPAKITDAVIGLWSRLLLAQPDARLRLKYRRVFADPGMQRQFKARFAAFGVPADRLDFTEGGDNLLEHLDFYRGIDVSLDPFPFTGMLSSFDSLWMGVPLVTLAGATTVSRMSAALLWRLGLDAWVARDADDYVRIATGLVADPVRLQAWRRTLRAQVATSPLCDGRQLARHVEQACRAAWRHWCAAG